LDRFFNYIYWWATKRVKDIERFEHHLYAPIPGEKATDEVVEQELEDFSAFASAFGMVAKPPAPEQPA
jgi:hypothetical protein